MTLTTIAILAVLTASPSVRLQESPAPSAAQVKPGQPPTDTEHPSVPGEDGERVHIRINIREGIGGWIQYEDENVIVLLDRGESISRYAKSQILQVHRLTEPAPDQLATVLLLDGQTRYGTVLEDHFDHVMLRIEGVSIRVERETIDLLQLHPSFEDRYRRMQANLDPENIPGHLVLCRWLVDEKRFSLALIEVEKLLQNHPLPAAERLKDLIEAQLALRETRTRQTEDHDRQERVETASRYPPGIIRESDVNIIRVYEIDFDDPNLRVAVLPSTIERLLSAYAGHPDLPSGEDARAILYDANALDIVELMFHLRARDLYREVKVLTEPASLNAFRLQVHDRWLIQNCATASCHGGSEAGRLHLHRRRHRDPRVRYTNFLILDRLELPAQGSLVNYDHPLESLIIQYALPEGMASTPHPSVPSYRPVFRSREDVLLKDTVAWIRSMLVPRPEYPVDFSPLEDVPPGGWDAPGP